MLITVKNFKNEKVFKLTHQEIITLKTKTKTIINLHADK